MPLYIFRVYARGSYVSSTTRGVDPMLCFFVKRVLAYFLLYRSFTLESIGLMDHSNSLLMFSSTLIRTPM